MAVKTAHIMRNRIQRTNKTRQSFYIGNNTQGINNNRQCLFYLENKKVQHYERMVDDMTKAEKAIEKASKHARELEKKYNAPVVWMGKNKFIIVKDGKEITVEV